MFFGFVCYLFVGKLKIRLRTALIEFACSLGFRRTLKIAARTLSDVVTRVRLCCHHTRRGLRGVSEVQSRWCGDAEMGRGRRQVLY